MLAQVERKMKRRGLELVRAPSRSEPMLVQVRLVERGPWVSLAVEQLEAPESWARFLAQELGVQALGAWFWDGEGQVALSLFEGDAAQVNLSLPADARRTADGRVAIALGAFSRLVGGARAATSKLDILVRDEGASFDAAERCVYLSAEAAERALCRAFGIDELFVDPLDEDQGDEPLYFRPRPTSAIAKRARAAKEAERAALRADHDGRVYTIGWLAFDAAARDIATLVDNTARPLVELLAPHLGTRVLQARSVEPPTDVRPAPIERALPAPADGETAWKLYARALREGALVDLGRRDTPVLAAIWLVPRDGALIVGWCMRGLRDRTKRSALATAMDAVVASGTADVRCFGALLTSQGSPMSLERQVLAYEYLRGTSELALRPATHRAHARAPGWRVLVPRNALPFDRQAPTGVTARATKAGLLLEADATDAHEMTPEAMDALETHLTAGKVLPVGGARNAP